MQKVALILTVGCVLLMTGCANLNPLPEKSEQLQHDALARWKSCLNREAGRPKSEQLSAAANELQSRCEGHRRDVLMSFPATVEPQLNALLMEHTLRSAFHAPIEGTNGSVQPYLNLPSAIAIQTAR